MILDNGHHSPLDGGSLHSSLLRRASVQHFPGGSFNFVHFETEKIDECVEFIQSLIHHSATLNGVSIEEMRKGVKIMSTGGGVHKFYALFSSVLGVEVQREDEMECLIEGLKFITHSGRGLLLLGRTDLLPLASFPCGQAQGRLGTIRATKSEPAAIRCHF